MESKLRHWKKGIVDLNSLVGHDSVRIGFVTINANGNNLLLDDLEFHVTGWSDSIYVPVNNMVIHPNPAVDRIFYVTLRTDVRQTIQFTLMDVQQRRVFSKLYENVLNQTFEFDMEGYQAGVYILIASGNSFNEISRIIVSE